MPSHMSFVEPLRPEWPSCIPMRAVVRLWTKSATRLHASRCASFQIPGQPGLIRPSGDTHVISVITRPAPPRAFDPRCTRWNSSGIPSVAQYMSIGERMTRFFSSRSPMRTGWNIAGAPSSPCWLRANSASIRAANSASRSRRFSKVIRRDRVSRLNTNCAGA